MEQQSGSPCAQVQQQVKHLMIMMHACMYAAPAAAEHHAHKAALLDLHAAMSTDTAATLRNEVQAQCL